jgi:hypothetical protein
MMDGSSKTPYTSSVTTVTGKTKPQPSVSHLVSIFQPRRRPPHTMKLRKKYVKSMIHIRR